MNMQKMNMDKLQGVRSNNGILLCHLIVFAALLKSFCNILKSSQRLVILRLADYDSAAADS